MVQVRRTPTERVVRILTTTAGVRRTPMAGAQPTPTPTEARRRVKLGMVRNTPLPTAPPHIILLRLIMDITRPLPTMVTILPPPWPFTEQDAITVAVAGRWQAPQLQALSLALLWPHPSLVPRVPAPTLRAIRPVRPTPVRLTLMPLPPTPMLRLPMPMLLRLTPIWPLPTPAMRWARSKQCYLPVASRPTSQEVEPTICAAIPGSSRPTAQTASTIA